MRRRVMGVNSRGREEKDEDGLTLAAGQDGGQSGGQLAGRDNWLVIFSVLENLLRCYEGRKLNADFKGLELLVQCF